MACVPRCLSETTHRKVAQIWEFRQGGSGNLVTTPGRFFSLRLWIPAPQFFQIRYVFIHKWYVFSTFRLRKICLAQLVIFWEPKMCKIFKYCSSKLIWWCQMNRNYHFRNMASGWKPPHYQNQSLCPQKTLKTSIKIDLLLKVHCSSQKKKNWGSGRVNPAPK